MTFWLSLPVHLGSLKRIDYPNRSDWPIDFLFNVFTALSYLIPTFPINVTFHNLSLMYPCSKIEVKLGGPGTGCHGTVTF